MKTVVVDAGSVKEARQVCQKNHGWTPDAVREVDSGGEYIRGERLQKRAWMCFESAADAELWDKQK